MSLPYCAVSPVVTGLFNSASTGASCGWKYGYVLPSMESK